MTQKQLILEYVKQNGSIVPARMSGAVYLGRMFGSESSRRCRELREAGILASEGLGKFERFYLPERKEVIMADNREELNLKLKQLRVAWLHETDLTKKEVIKRQGLAIRRALEAEEYENTVKQALL